MEREKIIKELKNYFAIHELVGSSTYNKHGERAWKYFETNALWMLLIIRQNLDKPITVNNWFWGGRFSQRGLRTNVQQIFRNMFKKMRLYLSAHVLGRAFDFDVEGMKATEVRSWIKENAHLFPFKIRLERNKNGEPINWVHADTIDEDHNPNIYEFDV